MVKITRFLPIIAICVSLSVMACDSFVLVDFLNGVEDLIISPDTARTADITTVQFEVLNGTGPFIWSVKQGPGGISDSGIYTPDVVGSAVIRAVDSSAPLHFGEAEIEIVPSGTINDLMISPATATITNFTTTQLEVLNGTGPFIWSIEQGSGSISESGVFTPGGIGTIVVRAIDSSAGEHYGEANIEVIATGSSAADLWISPGTVVMAEGDTLNITVGGGDGNYTISKEFVTGPEDDGKLVDNGDGTAVYTASLPFLYSAILKVVDGSGAEAYASVIIERPGAPIVISPAVVTLAWDESTNFTATGGTTPLSWWNAYVIGGAHDGSYEMDETGRTLTYSLTEPPATHSTWSSTVGLIYIVDGSDFYSAHAFIVQP